MEKEFVPYELAVKIKELGFDDDCLAAYFVFGNGKLINGSYRQTESELFINGIGKEIEDRMEELRMFAYHEVSVPTFSQAFRWFREKYKLSGTPQYFTGGYYCYTINDMKDTKESNRLFTEFKTFEEAELACLDKLIEIVEEA